MKLIRKSILLVLISAVAMLSCGQKGEASKASSSFVKVENGLFVCDNYPSHFIGTNFWYGAILGSEGEGGEFVPAFKVADFGIFPHPSDEVY